MGGSDTGSSLMAEEKSLPPTPRKREKARREGWVARSPDLCGASVILAGTAALLLFGEGVGERIGDSLSSGLGGLAGFEDPLAGMVAVGETLLLVLGPLGLVLGAVAVAAGLAQGGWALNLRNVRPDPSRLGPGGKAGERWVRTGLGVLKILAVAAVVLWTAHDAVVAFLEEPPGGPRGLGGWWGQAVAWVLFRGAAALLFLGVLDLLYRQARLERDLGMSRSEAVEELRENEGDPHVRRRRERRRMEVLAGMFQEGSTWLLTAGGRVTVVLAERPEPVVLAVLRGPLAAAVIRAVRRQDRAVRDDPALALRVAAEGRIGQELPAGLGREVREAFA